MTTARAILKKYEKQFIQIGLLITVSIVLIRPLGIPVPITTYSTTVYDIIESLQPGDKVIVEFSMESGHIGAMSVVFVPLFQHMMERGLIIYNIGIATQDGVSTILDNYLYKMVKPSDYGYEYGVDHCNLGYIPGGIVAYVNFANDVKGTVPTDQYGTPLEELPMMADVETLDDFDIIVCWAGGTITTVVSQWSDPYEKPIIYLGLLSGLPKMIPYIKTGQITAMMGGAQIGAEYHALVGTKGRANAMVDAVTMINAYFISMVVLGNIIYLFKKGGNKR